MTDTQKKILKTARIVLFMLFVFLSFMTLASSLNQMQSQVNYLENEVENIKLAQKYASLDYGSLPYYEPVEKSEESTVGSEQKASDTVLYYTEDDVIMLTKLLYRECRGISSKAEKSAVVWTVLNRVDDPNEFPDTISGVVQQKNQFAYHADTPISTELLSLSYDVLCRWNREKNGETDVGRTLPQEYEYFKGDGLHNHFYKLNADGYLVEWDFQWGSPYGD